MWFEWCWHRLAELLQGMVECVLLSSQALLQAGTSEYMPLPVTCRHGLDVGVHAAVHQGPWKRTRPCSFCARYMHGVAQGTCMGAPAYAPLSLTLVLVGCQSGLLDHQHGRSSYPCHRLQIVRTSICRTVLLRAVRPGTSNPHLLLPLLRQPQGHQNTQTGHS